MSCKNIWLWRFVPHQNGPRVDKVGRREGPKVPDDSGILTEYLIVLRIALLKRLPAEKAREEA
jgi:hypothetical protein